jgi:hypothetical protein
MIKPQHFTALAAVTLLSVAFAAGLYTSSNRWASGTVEGALLLPELDRQINKIGSVEIVQGTKKLTLERAGDGWKVKDRNGYPASAEKVRSLLVALAGAQLIEPKTASKDRHPLLELEDPSAKDAKSKGVRIRDTAGKPLAEVVLGKSRYDAFGSGRGGTYVRRLGDAQTWLATGEPKATAELKDWVSPAVFAMATDKISKLTIEHPGEAPLVIEKSDSKDGKFKFAQMPEGQKLKQGVTIDQIAQAFGSIDLDDVRKLDAAPAGDGVSTFKLEEDGGPIVTFRLRKDADGQWLSVTAVGENTAKARADEINAKTTGWEFKIQPWKADQINKRHADLFETS